MEEMPQSRKLNAPALNQYSYSLSISAIDLVTTMVDWLLIKHFLFYFGGYLLMVHFSVSQWYVFNRYLRLRPTKYAISSLTAKESRKWIKIRCSCPMTCTRWRKKRSGSTTHRHRPTSRRLTSISSTASGRYSRFRSIMTIAMGNNFFRWVC